jgi:predicted HTH transcriptional regulator
LIREIDIQDVADMKPKRNHAFLETLVAEMRKLPAETEWVEFKLNNALPEDIGQYVSALSNSAALCDRQFGYLIWGIEDKSHNIVGTSFNPQTTKKGNQNLELWLSHALKPSLHFEFYQIEIDEKRIVVLEVPRAHNRPTQFKDNEFLRIGSCCNPLRDHPDRERVLWQSFEKIPYEKHIANENLGQSEVLELLSYKAYYELLGVQAPENEQSIIDIFEKEGFLVRNPAGNWDITNIGAILFAKNLSDFNRLARKAVRVVFYEGIDRRKTRNEVSGSKGYALGFAGLIEYINDKIPKSEQIGQVFRREMPTYPEIAIRELIANALIHQDLSIPGTGPMIEVFSNRIEITNPGSPLVKTERFLDSPPCSRNESLASFMRRARICEERGSGIDKVVFETELLQLPAPSFENPDGSTRVILFAHKKLIEMDKNERIRACYLHACLRYVQRDLMTNASLRARFGIEEKNAAIASRIIRETLTAEFIKASDPDQGKKYAKYEPFWA